jgi:TolB protein
MRTSFPSVFLLCAGVLASAACSEGRGIAPRDTGGNAEGGSDQDVVDELVAQEDAAMGMDATVEEDSSVTPPADSATGTDAARDAVVPPRDAPIGMVDLVVRVGTAPMNAPDLFTGPEVGSVAAPTIVYPDTGTVVPPNLTGLEYHLRGPGGVELYELTFRGSNGRVRVYSPCVAVGGGCAVSITDPAMVGLAQAALGGEMQVTVRARTAAGAGRAATATLGVSQSDIRGGVYYWTVAGATNAIERFDWGIGAARREPFVQGNAFACVGCHALSRDGARITVGVGIPGPATTNTYDVLSRMTVGAAYGANFATFSPDNSKLLTSNGAVFTMIDPVAGTTVAGFPSGVSGTQPDWSPDATRVVYALPRGAIPLGSPGHSAPADLQILTYDPAMRRFSGTRSLIASGGENNYYPHFAPDSDWVIFNRSSGGSSSAPDARLWAVRASGGAPIELATTNGMGDRVNSWPRWAPFRDNYDAGSIYWFTFSSHRDYGLRLSNSGAMNPTAQLWMAAFRIQRGEMRMDPSTPPFWLPFQSVSASNHIAQWTEQVRRRTCANNMECPPGERCVSLISAGGMRCVGGT